MQRRSLIVAAAGAAFAPLAIRAQTRSPRNVEIDFESRLVPLSVYRTQLEPLFGGALLSATQQAVRDSADRASTFRLRKAAVGPRLEEGRTLYAVQCNTELIALDLPADRSGATPELPAAADLRPAFLMGERPHLLLASASLRAGTLDAVGDLAVRRGSDGRPLRCITAGRVAEQLARRLATLAGVGLELTMQPGGSRNPAQLLQEADWDLYLGPADPRVLAPQLATRATLVAALVLPGRPVWAAATGGDDGLARIAAGSRWAPLAAVPSRGFFVSADESPADVERLFAALRAALRNPEARRSEPAMVPLDFESQAACERRFAADVKQLRALAAG